MSSHAGFLVGVKSVRRSRHLPPKVTGVMIVQSSVSAAYSRGPLIFCVLSGRALHPTLIPSPSMGKYAVVTVIKISSALQLHLQGRGFGTVYR